MKILILLFALFSVSAQADELLDIAIVGSLLSYYSAYTNKNTCSPVTKVSIETSNDAEIVSSAFSASLISCDSTYINLQPTLYISKWVANSGYGNSSANEISIIPRASFISNFSNFNTHFSFGIGLSFLSNTSIGNRIKSTHLQFADELSIGISDIKNTSKLSLIYHHLSNLGISLPNNGVNFIGVSLSLNL